MIEFLEKIVNELPTLAIAVWAILNAAGIDVTAEDQTAWIAGVESVLALAIWLLVRRRTDGPVTAYKQYKEEH